MFADYTCKTLCGPMVSVVSDALRQTGSSREPISASSSIGLDPKDLADDARAMKDAQVGTDGDLPPRRISCEAKPKISPHLQQPLVSAPIYDENTTSMPTPRPLLW